MCGLFTRGFVRFVRFYLLWVSGLTCRGSVCSAAHRISGTFQLLPSLLPWSVGPELVRPWSGHASKHFFFFLLSKTNPFLSCFSLLSFFDMNSHVEHRGEHTQTHLFDIAFPHSHIHVYIDPPLDDKKGTGVRKKKWNHAERNVSVLVKNRKKGVNRSNADYGKSSHMTSLPQTWTFWRLWECKLFKKW